MRLIVYIGDVCLLLLMTSHTLQRTLSSLRSDDVPSPLSSVDNRSLLSSDAVPSSLLLKSDTYNITTPSSIRPGKMSTAVTGDTCLYIREELRLTCSLYDQLQHRYSASNICFRFTQPLKEDTDVKDMPMSNMQVINSTSAMLTIRNVSLDDAGQYTCFVADSFCPEDQNMTFVGFSNDVTIDYCLQNVTNFKCVVYNWDVSMTCTWKHPINYANWSNIMVTSSYTCTAGRSYTACPAHSTHDCQWTGDNFSTEDIYIVRVEVTNICKNDSVSTTFYVNTLKSVKPSPVEDLTAVPSLNETGCLLLSWIHPKQWRHKVYRIKHQNSTTGTFDVLIDTLLDTTYTACGYQPYTHHNFSVESYPTTSTSGYWSDPVYKDAWTSMTAPDCGPRTMNGSYTSTKCVNEFRNVTVMWQEVDITAQHGVIKGYRIKIGERNLIDMVADVYSASVELPCDSDSYLEIEAYNEGGYSLRPAVLHISPVTFTVSKKIQDTLTVEIVTNNNTRQNQEHLHLSWQEDHATTEDMAYIIFWCKRQQLQTCKNKISWSEVPREQTHFDILISDTDAGDYLYGVSVKDISTEMASAIFWSECLFQRQPSNVPPVQNLEVTSLVKSASVSWNAIWCSSQYQVQITSYIVKWRQAVTCNGSETEGISQDIVSATTSSYLIPSLTANVNYCVTVQPVSYDVQGIDVIPWKNVMPSDSDTETPLGAALGGLASGVVVLLIVSLLYIKCKSRSRKFKTLNDNRFSNLFHLNHQSVNLPVSGMNALRTVKKPQLVVSTTDTTDLSQENIDEITDQLDMEGGSPGQGDIFLENNFLLGKSGKSFTNSHRHITDIVDGILRVEQSSLVIDNTDIMTQTSPMYALTSDYVQHITVSQSDDTSQRELAEDSLEQQQHTTDYIQQIIVSQSDDTSQRELAEDSLEQQTNDYIQLIIVSQSNDTSQRELPEDSLEQQTTDYIQQITVSQSDDTSQRELAEDSLEQQTNDYIQQIIVSQSNGTSQRELPEDSLEQQTNDYIQQINVSQSDDTSQRELAEDSLEQQTTDYSQQINVSQSDDTSQRELAEDSLEQQQQTNDYIQQIIVSQSDDTSQRELAEDSLEQQTTDYSQQINVSQSDDTSQRELAEDSLEQQQQTNDYIQQIIVSQSDDTSQRELAEDSLEQTSDSDGISQSELSHTDLGTQRMGRQDELVKDGQKLTHFLHDLESDFRLNLPLTYSRFVRYKYTRKTSDSSLHQDSQQSEQEFVFTDPGYVQLGQQSAFTDPDYVQAEQEPVFTDPEYEESVQESSFTDPDYVQSGQESIFTDPGYVQTGQESVLTETESGQPYIKCTNYYQSDQPADAQIGLSNLHVSPGLASISETSSMISSPSSQTMTYVKTPSSQTMTYVKTPSSQTMTYVKTPSSQTMTYVKTHSGKESTAAWIDKLQYSSIFTVELSDNKTLTLTSVADTVGNVNLVGSDTHSIIGYNSKETVETNIRNSSLETNTRSPTVETNNTRSPTVETNTSSPTVETNTRSPIEETNTSPTVETNTRSPTVETNTRTTSEIYLVNEILSTKSNMDYVSCCVENIHEHLSYISETTCPTTADKQETSNPGSNSDIRFIPHLLGYIQLNDICDTNSVHTN